MGSVPLNAGARPKAIDPNDLQLVFSALLSTKANAHATVPWSTPDVRKVHKGCEYYGFGLESSMNLLQFGGVVGAASAALLLRAVVPFGFLAHRHRQNWNIPPPFDSFLSIAINSLSWPSFIAFHLLCFHFHSFPFTSFLELNDSPSKTTRYNKYELHN